jgi:hypothetical protein
MTTVVDKSRVIVKFGPSETHTVTCAHAHHHNVPEIDAEGESVLEAVTLLHKNLLNNAVDQAPSDYRRRVFEEAVADVEEFLNQKP